MPITANSSITYAVLILSTAMSTNAATAARSAHLFFIAAGVSCIIATATIPSAAALSPAIAPISTPLSPSEVMNFAMIRIITNDGMTTPNVETTEPARPFFLYPT